MKKSLYLVFLFAFLVACGGAVTVPATTVVPADLPTVTPTLPFTSTPVPTQTPTQLSSATPDTRLSPDHWQEWPIIPERVSSRTIEIYLQGQELGNNPQAFSKIGDCESITDYFLVPFDGQPSGYSLGSSSGLQTIINYFHDSYKRTSLASGKGWTAANELTALWADRKNCNAGEMPLACEVRVNRPSFALIMLGTNDVYHQDTFETNMHSILDFLVEKGVVPILATKADNLEGDNAINAAIVRLAYEYDIPLWNFWLAVQPLPDHGLQPDGSHLTWAGHYFDDPVRMRAAWPWRNLTALQILDMVWRGVISHP